MHSLRYLLFQVHERGCDTHRDEIGGADDHSYSCFVEEQDAFAVMNATDTIRAEREEKKR